MNVVPYRTSRHLVRDYTSVPTLLCSCSAFAIVLLSAHRFCMKVLPTSRHFSKTDTAASAPRLVLILASLIVPISSSPLWAGSLIHDDPKGFDGLAWGSSLAGREELKLVDSGSGEIKGYDRKEGPLPLGQVPVDFMRYIAIGDKFARVTIRYHGKETHNQILAYLQSQYGELDRTPGQMVRGLNQQFNWRGTDTEINMTYEAQGDRGYVFFDSRVLSPRFNDNIADDAY